MLFPNLIVLALGSTTHLNTLTEIYISAVLLVIAAVLIALSNHRDLGGARHIIFYVPVAFLVFTLAQEGDTLFGFQLAWYLIVLALAVVIFLLNTSRVGWLVLLAAIAAAVVGSYSSLQGLLIWPVGLVVLLWRHSRRTVITTWLAAAVVTTAIYFYNFNRSDASSSGSYVLSHPLAAAKFFFFNVGDIMGWALPDNPGASNTDILGLGVMIFLLAVVCLIAYARPGHLSKSPVGPALICFGLLFAATVTYGRSSFGLAVASQDRYVTFNLLTLVGCYLCLLEGWPGRERESVGTAFAPIVRAVRDGGAVPLTRDVWRQGFLAALRVLAILLIVIQVEGGFRNGRADGAGTRYMFQNAALVAAHAACAPNALIKSALFPNAAYQISNVRDLAVAAKGHHLSLFGTSEASEYEHTKLPHVEGGQSSQTSVLKPTSGELLRGNTFLVANASANCSIKGVSFQIADSAGQHPEVLRAQRFLYGWLGGWRTTDVPNGSYTVRSTVRDSAGDTRTSEPVSVTVQN
jgi:hypothetical protein